MQILGVVVAVLTCARQGDVFGAAMIGFWYAYCEEHEWWICFAFLHGEVSREGSLLADQKSRAIIVFVSAANIYFVDFAIFTDKIYEKNIRIQQRYYN